METIRVDSAELSKTGKSVLVKSGDKTYFAKPDQGIKAGMTIEAEIKESEYQGKKNYWINAYKVVSSAPVNGNGGNGVSPPWMPFVSNTVAHAISAGLIKEPHELGMWASAARNWATGKAESMDEAQGDIPY